MHLSNPGSSVAIESVSAFFAALYDIPLSHTAKRKAIMCDDVLSLAKSLDIKLNIPKARIQIGKQAV